MSALSLHGRSQHLASSFSASPSRIEGETPRRYALESPPESARRSSRGGSGMSGGAAQQQYHRNPQARMLPPEPLHFSPLALALQAQWALLQRQLSASGGSGSGSPSQIASEKDLARTLQRLPQSLPEVLRDAGNTTPFLLAFAVAPIPSTRTQVLALLALQEVLASLVGAWGRAAAEQFMRELFLGEHHALEALEVALTITLEEVHDDGNDEDLNEEGVSTVTDMPANFRRTHTAVPSRSAISNSTSKRAQPAVGGLSFNSARRNQSMAVPPSEKSRMTDRSSAPPSSLQKNKKNEEEKKPSLRATLVGGIIDIIFTVALLSEHVASVMLRHPALIKALVQYLPESSPMQATCIASILHALAKATPLSASILTSYNTHHAVMRYMRSCVRPTYNGRGDLHNGGTVTTMYVMLQVIIHLCHAPGVFDLLYDDDALCTLIAHVVTLPWANLVELGCIWVSTLLSLSPRARGPLLVRRLMLHNKGVGSALTRMVRWDVDAEASYPTAAAMCWRWMLLSAPELIGERIIKDPGTLMLFLQALVSTEPLRGEGLDTSLQMSEESYAAVSSQLSHALFIIEITICLALCALLAEPQDRASLRLLIVEKFTESTLHALRAASEAALAVVSEDYFDAFPDIPVENGEAIISSSVRQPSHKPSHDSTARALYNTNISSEAAASANASSAEVNTPRNANGEQQQQEEGDPWHWKHQIQCALAQLFASDAPTDATFGPPPTTTAQSRSPSLLLPSRLMNSSAAAHSECSASRLWQMPGSASQQHQDPSSSASAVKGPGASVSYVVHANTSRSRILRLHREYLSFEVVKRAALLGGGFDQECVQTVVRLSHHYIKAGKVGEGKRNSHSFLDLQQQRSSSWSDPNLTGLRRSSSVDPNTTSASSPLQHLKQQNKKNANPWAKPQAVRPSLRWRVADLEQTDMVCFAITYENIVRDLAEAIDAVQKHMEHLHQELQICPIRERVRRCVLNDLYMHAYPKIHLFLRYIQHQVGRVRAVLQIFSNREGDVCIHAGNIIEMYDAVGHCVGDDKL